MIDMRKCVLCCKIVMCTLSHIHFVSSYAPTNCYSYNNLYSITRRACLWWKSISGNDITSLVYDYGLSYDLLPPISRGIVHGRLCKLYPRLHHANVEIR